MTTPLERSAERRASEPQHRVRPRAVDRSADLDPRALADSMPPPDSASPKPPLACPRLRSRRRARPSAGALAEQHPERVRELRDGRHGAAQRRACATRRLPAGCAGITGAILIAPDGRELLCEPGARRTRTGASLLPPRRCRWRRRCEGWRCCTPRAWCSRQSRAVRRPARSRQVLAGGGAAAPRRRSCSATTSVALELRDGGLIAHPARRCCSCARPSTSGSPRASARPSARPEAFLGKQRYIPSDAASPAPFGELFLLERSAARPADRADRGGRPVRAAGEHLQPLGAHAGAPASASSTVVSALAATERIYVCASSPASTRRSSRRSSTSSLAAPA